MLEIYKSTDCWEKAVKNHLRVVCKQFDLVFIDKEYFEAICDMETRIVRHNLLFWKKVEREYNIKIAELYFNTKEETLYVSGHRSKLIDMLEELSNKGIKIVLTDTYCGDYDFGVDLTKP